MEKINARLIHLPDINKEGIELSPGFKSKNYEIEVRPNTVNYYEL